MVVLKLFGAVYLEGDTGVLSGAAVQRHRLALLALLATARSHTLPREKLMELLWPDRSGEQARNLLKQSIYVLRKVLGDDAIKAVGDGLRLDTGIVQCDAVSFEQAVKAGDFARAVELYTGPFLDAFFLNNAQDFEDWMRTERARLADAYESALETLADGAEKRGEVRTATEYWKLLVAHRPLDTGAMLRLMRSLEASGDPGSALLRAEQHERLLKDELGMRPPAEMVEMIARLQGLKRDAAAPRTGSPADEPADSVASPSIAAPQPVASPSSKEYSTPTVNEGPADRPWRRYAPAVAAAIGIAVFIALFVNREPATVGPPAPSIDEIAKVVAEEVDRRLRGDEDTDDPARRTASIAAYEAYLRGNEPAKLRSPAAAAQALAWFRKAVEIDPSYAAAWVGVAKMSLRVSFDDSDNADQLYEQATEAAHKAVALDGSYAEAHAITGWLYMANFDLQAAEASWKRALALDPGRGETREWLVTLHLWMGNLEQALAEATRAAQLDPLSPGAAAELARALAANGRCDDALQRLETIRDVDPPLLRVPLIVAHCHAQEGRWQTAIASLAEANADSGPLGQTVLGYVLARSGQREDALGILDTLHAQWQTGEGGAFPIAVLHGGLGDRDQVFAWLERSIEDRSLEASPDQFTMLQPILDELRGDPRFESLPVLAAWSEAGRL